MNFPDVFQNSKNILFAGIGGGFDIFGAIPLWVSLRNSEKKFAFSNYNPSYVKFTEAPDIYPESQLNEFFKNNKFIIPFYVLPKIGVKPYVEMYNKIIKDNNIDTVVAIDGGVDSLMHGDEDGAGTILEDFANLIALDKVNCSTKLLVCSGFGTELEEDVCHHHVLENMATLVKNEGFLGSCSLIGSTEEFNLYKQACEWVWTQGRKSHIQTKVISSVLGLWGDTNAYSDIEANVVGVKGVKNYLSPLMAIYWFFKLDKVAEENVLYNQLVNTVTKTDLLMAFRQTIDNKKRPKKLLPW